MAAPYHIDDFPTQAELSAFLRTLLSPDLTQVELARRSGVPYNTLTNYFTEKPSRMSGEALSRIVRAAGAEERFCDWLEAGRQAASLQLHDATAEAANAGRARRGKSTGT